MRLSRLVVVFSVAAALPPCNPVLADAALPEEGPGFSLGGYSSAGVQLHPGGHAEAALNEVSLILNWDGGGRLRAFAEFEVEKPLFWEEGESLTTDDAYFDVERLYADYSLSGSVNLRAGRFLTPIGRWNLIHAAPLVWTSLRPAATYRLFPLAVNGAMLHGAIPWGEAAVEYAAYAEAVRDQTDDPGEVPFEHTRGLRVNYSGTFELGLSLAAFRRQEPGQARYQMLGLDFYKSWSGYELSGELYQAFEHGDQRDSGGGYLQGVAPLGNRWYAVGRLESLREPGQGAEGRWLLGAAWRRNNAQVLKLEYVGGREAHPHMPRGLVASYAILF